MVGIQANHARLSDYEREISISRERYQSCSIELENKCKEFSQAVARIEKLERRLADSETDMCTLSVTFVRSDHEHATALEKYKADQDLTLRFVFSNTLQQDWEKGEQQGLVVGIKFCHQQIVETLVGQHFLQILKAYMG